MAALAGAATVMAQPACPAAQLRIAFMDNAAAPFLLGSGERFAEPPGLLVDWLRAALRRLGCLERAQLLRMPTARLIRAIAEDGGQIDLYPGVAENAPFAAKLVLPPPASRPDGDLSVGEVRYSLYARRGEVPAWDGQTLVLGAGQAVGVARGSVAENLARRRGWPLEPAPNTEAALRKLLVGRSRAMLVYEPYLDPRIERGEPPVAGLVKLQPPVERTRFHVGASRDFYAAHPAFVQQLWLELCRQGNALHEKPRACSASAFTH